MLPSGKSIVAIILTYALFINITYSSVIAAHFTFDRASFAALCENTETDPECRGMCQFKKETDKEQKEGKLRLRHQLDLSYKYERNSIVIAKVIPTSESFVDAYTWSFPAEYGFDIPHPPQV